jgi:ABC-type uncharacterized transport system involved in gliding motility auxiliary subunit
MRFASSLDFVGDSSRHYIPLAHTSQQSGTRKPPLRFNVRKEWTQQDFTSSKLTVAAALKGGSGTDSPGRMVVIGDGDFTTQRGNQQTQRDKVSLLVNSIDWLSDETGLMSLRTKGITSRPLKQISRSKQTFLKYFNFLVPMVVIIVIGILRFQQNRIIRKKRMEADYV